MWVVVWHPRPIDLHDRTGTGTDTNAVIKAIDEEQDDTHPRACHVHRPALARRTTPVLLVVTSN